MNPQNAEDMGRKLKATVVQMAQGLYQVCHTKATHFSYMLSPKVKKVWLGRKKNPSCSQSWQLDQETKDEEAS